jgi:outer membrane PBP1 activator LpoA protein
MFKEADKAAEKAGLGRSSGIVELYLANSKFNTALKLLKEMTPNQFNPPHEIQYYTQRGLALKGSGL